MTYVKMLHENRNISSDQIYFQKMLDLLYIYIFGNFYFYESSFLVNHTNCIKICDKQEMKLPYANDNHLILKHLRSRFGSQFKKEMILNETKPNNNFLAYFIGSLNIQSLDYRYNSNVLQNPEFENSCWRKAIAVKLKKFDEKSRFNKLQSLKLEVQVQDWSWKSKFKVWSSNSSELSNISNVRN